MNNKDFLQNFIFENSPVRGEITRLNESYKAIMQRHAYPPEIQKLLGEALAAVSLLRSIIKSEGYLTIQFKGSGKLKILAVQCDKDFQLRGLVKWDHTEDDENILDSLSSGLLSIIIDPNNPNGKHYQGIVEWKNQSLAKSLEEYFYQSEQLPTRIWLSADENTAAGLLLQQIPKEKPELYEDDWVNLITLTETVKPSELLNLDSNVLIKRLYAEDDVRIFEKKSVSFYCRCSAKRCENAILTLGQKESELELKTKKQIIITCEFCNKEYAFDKVDVANIFKRGSSPDISSKLQ